MQSYEAHAVMSKEQTGFKTTMAASATEVSSSCALPSSMWSESGRMLTNEWHVFVSELRRKMPQLQLKANSRTFRLCAQDLGLHQQRALAWQDQLQAACPGPPLNNLLGCLGIRLRHASWLVCQM